MLRQQNLCTSFRLFLDTLELHQVFHVPDDSIRADNQTDGRVSRSSSSVSTDHWLADPRDTSQ